MTAIVYNTPQEKLNAIRQMVHLKDAWEERMVKIFKENYDQRG